MIFANSVPTAGSSSAAAVRPKHAIATVSARAAIRSEALAIDARLGERHGLVDLEPARAELLPEILLCRVADQIEELVEAPQPAGGLNGARIEEVRTEVSDR